MPLKPDHNLSIKDYMQGTDKQPGQSKITETKISKQTTKPANMSKEAGTIAGVKGKVAKLPKDDLASLNENQANPNQKRDVSTRSPLEGNPGKKQKEYNVSKTNNIKEQNTEGTTKENKLDIFSSASNQADNRNHDTHHNDKDEQPILSNSLLHELKEIKNTLLNLDAKIESSHQNLSSRIIDNKEMKELLAAQNNKIVMLYNKNKELKSQINKLKKETIEEQEEALRLKVDIMGIPKVTYETYDQLHSKVAEVMVPTCEGNTKEARWNTSISIPLIDFQH